MPYRTPSLEITMSPVCYLHCLYAALHDRCLIAWYLNILSSQNNTTLTSFTQLQAMDSHRIPTGFLTLSNSDGCNSAEFNQTTEEEPMPYQFSIYLVSRTSTTWIIAPNLASKLWWMLPCMDQCWRRFSMKLFIGIRNQAAYSFHNLKALMEGALSWG